jgi:hypothetical protein
MTGQGTPAKLEALARELDDLDAPRWKDDSFHVFRVYDRIVKLGPEAVDLLLTRQEAHPDWHAVDALGRIAAKAADCAVTRRVLEAVIAHHQAWSGACDIFYKLAPQVDDPALRDRMARLLAPQLSHEGQVADEARKALRRLGGPAAEEALKGPAETIHFFGYTGLEETTGRMAYVPTETVVLQGGLFYLEAENGERTYIGNLNQSGTSVYKHSGAPGRGKGTCVGVIRESSFSVGILKPDSDYRWSPEPWLTVNSVGEIELRRDEGEYLSGRCLGKGEGGRNDMILAAALLLIKTKKWD